MTTKPRKLTPHKRSEWLSDCERWARQLNADPSEEALLDALHDLDAADEEIAELQDVIKIRGNAVENLQTMRDDALAKLTAITKVMEIRDGFYNAMEETKAKLAKYIEPGVHEAMKAVLIMERDDALSKLAEAVGTVGEWGKQVGEMRFKLEVAREALEEVAYHGMSRSLELGAGDDGDGHYRHIARSTIGIAAQALAKLEGK